MKKQIIKAARSGDTLLLEELISQSGNLHLGLLLAAWKVDGDLGKFTDGILWYLT